MWLRLTSVSGRTIIIDADKAIDIQEEASGSKVFFSSAIRNKDGSSVVRSTRVREEAQEIAEALQQASRQCWDLRPQLDRAPIAV